MTLEHALAETRTGDIWLFRGDSGPDRAIQTMSNAPVNHVGMTVAIDDLPPLIWHAELGDKLQCLWSGTNHRGVQLNDAREAVEQAVRDLEARGITPLSAEHEYVPSLPTELPEEQATEALTLIDKLEQDEDVQKGYHNLK